MSRTTRFTLAALSLSLSSAILGAQGAPAAAPAAPPANNPAPAVGEMAPDFTATWADASGIKAKPISLKDLKGKVAVLAFYPLDRSGGCTIEMHKFRDDYATLFGDGVVVLPVSIDTLESHVGWAKDEKFPFGMISDPKRELAIKYGSNGAKYFKRTIFVIGKDGKVAYTNMAFSVNTQEQWDVLAAEIKKAKG
ncbi:MAG: peroxiredoxin family protein [Gemmatimonadaceae bacterium]